MNAMHNAPASDPSLVYPSPLKEFWQAFAHNKGALGGLLFMLLMRESEINQKGKARKLWDIEEGKGI